jgi:predicted nuclease of predicted toxin-antitoxin system
MKLLFDENLSPKLPRMLAAFFPDSAHVSECGLKGRHDEDIWEYARDHGFVIISKDADFQQRGLLYGHPPRIVWLRIGNCTKEELFRLITSHEGEIRALEIDPFETVLVLS